MLNAPRKQYKGFIALIAFLAVAVSSVVSSSAVSADKPKAPKTKMDTLTITCASSTQASISLQICAGATGAPAGFSLQWTTAARLAAGPDGTPGTFDDNTWPSSDSSDLCHASFSGNANLSRYE